MKEPHMVIRPYALPLHCYNLNYVILIQIFRKYKAIIFSVEVNQVGRFVFYVRKKQERGSLKTRVDRQEEEVGTRKDQWQTWTMNRTHLYFNVSIILFKNSVWYNLTNPIYS
jgi:hypothetical protein